MNLMTIGAAAWRRRGGPPTPPPPGSFPVYVSSTTSSQSSDTSSHTVNLPARNAGDLLIIQFVNDGSATVTPDAGLTGIQTVFTTERATDYRTSVYAWIAPSASAANTATFTTSANERSAAIVHRIAAGTFHASTLPQAAMELAGTGVNPDPPNLAPSWGTAKTLWLVCYTSGNVTAANLPSAYPYPSNNVSNPDGGGGGVASVAAISCTTTAEVSSLNPGVFTKSGTANWSAYTIAIRPA